MNTVFKPDPLPQRPGKQVTHGKHLTLWEPDARYRLDNYSVVDRLMLRLKKSEIDKAAGAVTVTARPPPWPAATGLTAPCIRPK